MRFKKLEDAIDFALQEKSVVQLDWGPIYRHKRVDYTQYYNFLNYFVNKLRQPNPQTFKSLINSDRNLLDFEGISCDFELENKQEMPKNYDDLKKIVESREIDAIIYPITSHFVKEINQACQTRNLNYESMILRFNQKIFEDFNSQDLSIDHLITCSKDFKVKSVGLNTIEHVRNEIILGELNDLVHNYKIYKFFISVGENSYITFYDNKKSQTFK